MNSKLKLVLIFIAVFVVMSIVEGLIFYFGNVKKSTIDELLVSTLITNAVIAGLWVLGKVSMKDMK